MKKQKCINCEFYNPYYIKQIYNYSRTKIGYCNKHKKEQHQFEVCKSYKSNQTKEKLKESLLHIYLEQALISINNISQILTEKENNRT